LKTIGLLGGMSWESSAHYYRIINQETRRRLGGVHSAQSLMHSVDFGEIERLQHQGEWDRLRDILIEGAKRLEGGGADFFILCTNTMHKLADELQRSVSIPFLHIVDPTARKIVSEGYTSVGLLGTAFTMEQEFYKGRLAKQYGLEVLVPDDLGRKVVHDVIYNELVAGKVEHSSRERYSAIITDMVERGAQAIILGCTEIMMLVSPADSPVPVFDTTEIHAISAVDLALTAAPSAAIR
jgi:aspartate racemase